MSTGTLMSAETPISNTEDLLVERQGGELWVTINRPRARNAINWNVRRALLAAMEHAAADPEIRVVVLAGHEVAFCAGGDIKEMGNGPEDSAAKLDYASKIIQLIATMPKPVVAAVQGHIAGAGIGLALACDLVYVSSNLVFSPSFALRGLGPDMSTSYWLTQSLGVARAKQLLLTAPTLNAEQFDALGLAAEVFDAAGFDAAVRDRVASLADGPTIAYGYIKKLALDAAGNSLAEQLDAEAESQAVLAATEDHRHAIASFAEKRPAVFAGR